MDKNLSYFMREELKNEEIVEMAGPNSIKDENGNPVVFKIKRLRRDRVDKIYDHYRTLKPALKKKKKLNPLLYVVASYWAYTQKML